eukprot:CFRG6882T1
MKVRKKLLGLAGGKRSAHSIRSSESAKVARAARTLTSLAARTSPPSTPVNVNGTNDNEPKGDTEVRDRRVSTGNGKALMIRTGVDGSVDIDLGSGNEDESDVDVDLKVSGSRKRTDLTSLGVKVESKKVRTRSVVSSLCTPNGDTDSRAQAAYTPATTFCQTRKRVGYHDDINYVPSRGELIAVRGGSEVHVGSSTANLKRELDEVDHAVACSVPASTQQASHLPASSNPSEVIYEPQPCRAIIDMSDNIDSSAYVYENISTAKNPTGDTNGSSVVIHNVTGIDRGIQNVESLVVLRDRLLTSKMKPTLRVQWNEVNEISVVTTEGVVVCSLGVDGFSSLTPPRHYIMHSSTTIRVHKDDYILPLRKDKEQDRPVRTAADGTHNRILLNSGSHVDVSERKREGKGVGCEIRQMSTTRSSDALLYDVYSTAEGPMAPANLLYAPVPLGFTGGFNFTKRNVLVSTWSQARVSRSGGCMMLVVSDDFKVVVYDFTRSLFMGSSNREVVVLSDELCREIRMWVDHTEIQNQVNLADSAHAHGNPKEDSEIGYDVYRDKLLQSATVCAAWSPSLVLNNTSYSGGDVNGVADGSEGGEISFIALATRSGEVHVWAWVSGRDEWVYEARLDVVLNRGSKQGVESNECARSNRRKYLGLYTSPHVKCMAFSVEKCGERSKARKNALPLCQPWVVRLACGLTDNSVVECVITLKRDLRVDVSVRASMRCRLAPTSQYVDTVEVYEALPAQTESIVEVQYSRTEDPPRTPDDLEADVSKNTGHAKGTMRNDAVNDSESERDRPTEGLCAHTNAKSQANTRFVYPAQAVLAIAYTHQVLVLETLVETHKDRDGQRMPTGGTNDSVDMNEEKRSRSCTYTPFHRMGVSGISWTSGHRLLLCGMNGDLDYYQYTTLPPRLEFQRTWKPDGTPTNLHVSVGDVNGLGGVGGVWLGGCATSANGIYTATSYSPYSIPAASHFEAFLVIATAVNDEYVFQTVERLLTPTPTHSHTVASANKQTSTYNTPTPTWQKQYPMLCKRPMTLVFWDVMEYVREQCAIEAGAGGDEYLVRITDGSGLAGQIFTYALSQVTNADAQRLALRLLRDSNEWEMAGALITRIENTIESLIYRSHINAWREVRMNAWSEHTVASKDEISSGVSEVLKANVDPVEVITMLRIADRCDKATEALQATWERPEGIELDGCVKLVESVLQTLGVDDLRGDAWDGSRCPICKKDLPTGQSPKNINVPHVNSSTRVNLSEGESESENEGVSSDASVAVQEQRKDKISKFAAQPESTVVVDNAQTPEEDTSVLCRHPWPLCMVTQLYITGMQARRCKICNRSALCVPRASSAIGPSSWVEYILSITDYCLFCEERLYSFSGSN